MECRPKKNSIASQASLGRCIRIPIGSGKTLTLRLQNFVNLRHTSATSKHELVDNIQRHSGKEQCTVDWSREPCKQIFTQFLETIP